MRIRAAVVFVLSAGMLALCASAHAESPRERAAKLMKVLAHDKSAEKRADAAKELGDMGAWDAVPALAAALKDPAADVRAGAAYSLVKLKDHAKEAVPALKEAITDRDRYVRYNVVVALHNMDAATPAELAEPIVSLLDRAEKDDLEPLVEMLVNQGLDDPTARKAILDAVDQSAPEVRMRILREMGHQDVLKTRAPWKAEVVTRLTPMMAGDRDPEVRREIIYLVGRSTKPVSAPVGEALLKALDDPSPDVRMAAAGTLNGIEQSPLPMKGVTHLTTKLKSPTPADRASAAQALGGFIGWRDHFTPLLCTTLATDKDPEVRLAVVGALGEIDDDKALPTLLKVVKADSDFRVRAAICTKWSESMIKLRFARTNTLEQALSTLGDLAANDPNQKVRTAAAAALAELKK